MSRLYVKPVYACIFYTYQNDQTSILIKAFRVSVPSKEICYIAIRPSTNEVHDTMCYYGINHYWTARTKVRRGQSDLYACKAHHMPSLVGTRGTDIEGDRAGGARDQRIHHYNCPNSPLPTELAPITHNIMRPNWDLSSPSLRSRPRNQSGLIYWIKSQRRALTHHQTIRTWPIFGSLQARTFSLQPCGC